MASGTRISMSGPRKGPKEEVGGRALTNRSVNDLADGLDYEIRFVDLDEMPTVLREGDCAVR